MENHITSNSFQEIRHDSIGFCNHTVQRENVIYTAKVHATGGRDGGYAQSDDRCLDVAFTLPGKNEPDTNPEQLFASGWSASFISAIQIAAGKMGIKIPSDIVIDTEIDLITGDDGDFLQARLNVHLAAIYQCHNLSHLNLNAVNLDELTRN